MVEKKQESQSQRVEKLIKLMMKYQLSSLMVGDICLTKDEYSKEEIVKKASSSKKSINKSQLDEAENLEFKKPLNQVIDESDEYLQWQLSGTLPNQS